MKKIVMLFWVICIVLCICNNEAFAYTDAAKKITIFNQGDWSGIPMANGNNLKTVGCGIFSTAHAIQWITNTKITDSEAFLRTLANNNSKAWLDLTKSLNYMYDEHQITNEVILPGNFKPSESYLIDHFNNGGVIIWHIKNDYMGHYLLAVDYTKHDLEGDGDEELLIQLVDSSWGTTIQSQTFNVKEDGKWVKQKTGGFPAYHLNTFEKIADNEVQKLGRKNGERYWIEYKYFAGTKSPYGGYTKRWIKLQGPVIDNIPRIAVVANACKTYNSASTTSTVAESLSKGKILYLNAKANEEWYRTEDGKYVRAADITIEENKATISDMKDLALVGVVKTNDGYLKDRPYEAADHHGRVVSKNKTVDIVGSVQNSHENTWYVTSDGYYIYSGDVTVYEANCTQLFTLSAKFTYNKAVNSHLLPYTDSPTAGSIKKGQEVTAKKFVVNKHGNIWAQLSDNSFVCFHDMAKDETYMTFKAHVTPPTHSTTYPTGNIKVTTSEGFWLKGPVEAKVPFLTVSTRVIDRKTGKDVTAVGSPVTVSPAATVRKLELWVKGDSNCLDSRTLFKKLAGTSGWYTYQLNVQFGFKHEGKIFKFGSEMNLVTSDFTVNNPTGDEPGATETPAPTEYSTLFTLSANFTYNRTTSTHSLPYANSPVAGSIDAGEPVTVTKFVVNEYGNIWVQLSDNSFVCYHDMGKNETYMTFHSHVTQPTHSTTYPTGNIKVTTSEGFWLKGPVEAKVPFLTVSTRVIDRTTGKDVTAVGSPVTVSPAATVRKLELWVKNDSTCLDSRTLFRKLAGSSGWYTYQLNVQFGFKHEGRTFRFGSEMNLVTSDFTVNNPTGEEPPSGDSSDAPVGDLFVPVESVIVSNEVSALSYGEFCEFICDVYPIDATNPDVTWTSSNEEVLKILPTDEGLGKVEYVGLGTTLITAKSNDGSGLSYSFEVVVIPHVSYSWHNEVEVLQYRQAYCGLTLSVSPAFADVNIRSTDDSVFVVNTIDYTDTDSSRQYNIGVIGIAPGSANLEVEVLHSKAQTVFGKEVTVRLPVYVESIDIYGLPNEMKVGETADLYFVFNPGNHDCDGWGVFSSDTSVAEVLYGDADWDENGNFVEPVIARASGQVTIRVEAHDGSGVFATHTITVKGSVLSGDANEDGLVNIYDVLLVLQYSSGWDVTLTTENADVDKDGVIGPSDAVQILRYCAGGDLVSALRALKDLLGGLDISALEIVRQPVDQYVSIDQKAQFGVTVTGEPAAYQWYINRNDGKGWCKLTSAVEATYVTSAVEADCDGFQYRSVITDVYGNELTSDIAVLHVVLELPVTGDASTPVLWLVLCVLSALGILFMSRRRVFR